MYKAINQLTETEIVILEPTWSGNLEQLRRWSQSDALVCQECQQPVRVRAGEVRTWHFAHKHRQNCVIGNESPQLLQTRALLYRWLVGKFGSERVTVEKRLPDVELARPIDCWVAGEVNFAYWIFETNLKPPNRAAVRTALTHPRIVPHWVFLAAMQHQDEENAECVHLTTTEREFAQATKYDAPIHPDGQSLHYLNEVSREIITYRGLRLVHKPQVYEGEPVCTSLSAMLALPKTGEFVHPGEYEKLKAFEKEQERLETERQRLEEERRKQLETLQRHTNQQSMAHLPLNSPAIPQTNFSRFSPPPPKPSFIPEKESGDAPVGGLLHGGQKSGICEYCGEQTQDWWHYDGKSGKCRCRKCLREGRNKSLLG